MQIFTVENLGCASHCVNLVTKIAKTQPGVLSARVDFQTESLAVKVDGSLDEAKLAADLAAEGYGLHPEGWITERMKKRGGKSGGGAQPLSSKDGL